MLWLGLHFPWLPLEICSPAAGTANGTTAGTDQPPAVVIENDRVMLANAAARRAGIVTGSTLATAHSVVPGLFHHRRDPERERERLTLLAETLYGFSARVTLSPASPGGPPSGIALEIGASLRLFGDAETLTERAAALCRELGHRARGRHGRTPLAALILARAGAENLGRASLNAAALEPERLPPERIERLANMGVRTLGQLLALPRSGLARRLGADLTDYLDRITGKRPDPRPLVAPAERFRASLHLLEPLQNKEALAFPMQRLLNDLQHWLVARQLGAERLRWHFAGSAPVAADAAGEDGRVCLPVRFARARQRREAFLDVTALPEDVIDITLEADGLVAWHTASHGLFQNLGGDTDTVDDASELVDQLRARLGAGACYSLETLDQHTPERAWQRVPALGRRRGSSEPGPGAAADQVVCAATRRPLWLFEPPRAVAAEQLTLLRGPERLHTGWWVLAEHPPDAVGAVSRPRLAGEESPSGEGSHKNKSSFHKKRSSFHKKRSSFHKKRSSSSKKKSASKEESLSKEESPSKEESAHGREQACARDYYVARHHNGAECWVFVDPWDRWFLHGYFA